MPSNTRLSSWPTRSCRRSPGCATGIRDVGFMSRPHRPIRPAGGSGSLRRLEGEIAPESRPVADAKVGGGTRAPPYIGERLAQPEHGGWRKRADGRKTSVVLGQIELVGGDHRNR